jgi:hypothetical protein
MIKKLINQPYASRGGARGGKKKEHVGSMLIFNGLPLKLGKR